MELKKTVRHKPVTGLGKSNRKRMDKKNLGRIHLPTKYIGRMVTIIIEGVR